MKKLFKLAVALCATIISFSAFAQDEELQIKKETVIINPFTKTAAVTQAQCDNIRAAVLSGISARGRFYVVDALTDSTLAKLYENRSYEDAVNDANWKEESETAYKSLGAQSLIIGTANNVSVSSKTDDKGKVTYTCEVTISLKVYNIMDGSMTASEDIKVTGSSRDSKDAAFNKAMSSINSRMSSFVDAHFKFESYILDLGEADKKGRMKELFILGGAEMGITKGLVFTVHAEKKIGPKVTKQQIGKIVAKEVMDGVTKCNITDGEDAIKTTFNDDPKKLTVILSHQRLTLF